MLQYNIESVTNYSKHTILDPSTCIQDDDADARIFVRDIECNIQAIKKAMFRLAQYSFPCLVAASIISTVSTVILAAFAVVDKGYPILKCTIGLGLLGSGEYSDYYIAEPKRT